jgi:hypothetical protein
MPKKTDGTVADQEPLEELPLSLMAAISRIILTGTQSRLKI